jgi:serine protease
MGLASAALVVSLLVVSSHGLGNETAALPTRSPSSPSVPGEWIVHFREGIAPERQLQATSSIGIAMKDRLASGRHFVISLPAGREGPLTQRLLTDPTVEFVEPNLIWSLASTPDDEFFESQWHLPMIQADDAWDITRGEGVTVAVLDTGVAFEDYGPFAQAPDLAGTTFISPHNSVSGNSHPNDDDGHGTHVAGTIAQNTDNLIGVAGVAPDATVMPVKVCLVVVGCPSSAIADGIYWAVDNGADVINLSLGGSDIAEAVFDALDYAESGGVVVVAAAGNGGDDAIGDPALDYPAAVSTVISVGAVGFDALRAPYSNYGSGEGESTLDLVAPGGDTSVDLNEDGYADGVLQNTFLHSCDSAPIDFSAFDYCFYQGTSMATPHVAGVAALVLSAHPDLTPAQVREALRCSALDLGEPGDDLEYGSGLVQAVDALRDADEDGILDCLDDSISTPTPTPSATPEATSTPFPTSSPTATPTPTPSPPPFLDVAEDHWAYASIAAIYNANITTGCSIDPPLYCPSDFVTRAEMAAFLIRALGETPIDPPSGAVFTDVPASHWAAGYVERLVQFGITSGFPDGTYRPNDSVDRGQMAAFLIRALNETPVDPPSGTIFTDVPTSHWAAGYVERLVQLGITAGYPDGTYRPDDSVDRSQMAAFIARAWGL